MEDEFEFSKKPDIKNIIIIIVVALIIVLYIVFVIYIPYKNKKINKPNDNSSEIVDKEDDEKINEEENNEETHYQKFFKSIKYPEDEPNGYIVRAKYDGNFIVPEYIMRDWDNIEYSINPNLIILPYIKVPEPSNEIDKINSEISEVFDNAVIEYNKLSQEDYCFIHYNYTYSRYKDVYSILIEENLKCRDNSIIKYIPINFSIDGKNLLFDDLIKLAGLTTDEVRERLITYVRENDDTNENGVIINYDDISLNEMLDVFDESVKNKTQRLTINSNGSINLIFEDHRWLGDGEGYFEFIAELK